MNINENGVEANLNNENGVEAIFFPRHVSQHVANPFLYFTANAVQHVKRQICGKCFNNIEILWLFSKRLLSLPFFFLLNQN